jgi:ComEC/Rec2-related protein
VNKLLYLKLINKYRQAAVISIILIFYNLINFPESMKQLNSFKESSWNRFASKETISLVFLITTGDENFKNKNLTKLFKETQIIHLLVISGSNIIVFLEFINIFILRKRKINYVIGILLILTYLKYTGYPQTLIRALISYAISETLNVSGIRYSTYPYLYVTVFVLVLVYIFGQLGLSFYLSASYSLAIIIFNRILINDQNIGKLSRFIIFNIYITAVSYLLFYKYNNFSTCTSFVANIFITTIFEPAVLSSYILYFLPTLENSQLADQFLMFFFKILEFTLSYIGFIKELTYNICNE